MEKCYPLEACALLFGNVKEKEVVVKDAVVVPNKESSDVSFTVDSELFYKIHQQMEGEGKQYVGVFHSHPTKSSPSRVDEEMMRLWPDLVWLIYSTLSKSFGAYIMKNGKLSEVEIRVV